MKRSPVVNGRFYPGGPDELRKEVSSFLSGQEEKKETRRGCVVPHAGYVFSGSTAGKVLGRIVIPDSVIILSPNHTGQGAEFSVWDGDAWETPLGSVAIDDALREKIFSCEHSSSDSRAHINEHSIEVELPFLQILNNDVSIVPVTIGSHDVERLTDFGVCIAEIISSGDTDVLILASSDMTHMESAESAREKDMMCIEKMKKVDAEGLFKTVTEHGITMCGIAPVTAMLAACRELGVGSGTLVEYTNSGEASGDYSQVVGYAGMLF